MPTQQETRTILAGETILKQGDEGNCAYIIESGLVEILLEKESGLIQSLGTRGTGSIIGEMAIIDNSPRTATIKALEDSTLLEITQQDFERRIEQADPVLKMVTQVVLARYRDMITRVHILGHSSDLSSLEEAERSMIEKTNAVDNIKLNIELKTALQNNELQLHYQPIINLKTGTIGGFEALMRWNHPEKGFIPPYIFINAAEESGLIVDLSRWAVQEACQALQNISKRFEFKSDLFMSVNFSALDFTAHDFKEHLSNTLKKFNLSPNQLHIEITERLLIQHPDEARETLKACHDEGIVISIDDFGTGYSSLSYLHYFPIDILKIDQSFIQNIKKDETSKELVKSIISLGHNMNMSIIAEGIEEADQADELRNLNCDKVQGYHFAKPMPEKDLEAYILKNKEKS